MKELEDLQAEVSKREQKNDKLIEMRKKRLFDVVVQVGDLPFEKIEEIGLELIRSYGILSLAAERLNFSEIKLRNILSVYPELSQLRQACLGGFKGLVDKEIVKEIEKGNSDILAIVFKSMYAGRDRGSNNFNEFGSIGDEDEHFAGKGKVQKQGIHVHIHFEDNDAKRASDFNAIDIEDYVDIEPEEG